MSARVRAVAILRATWITLSVAVRLYCQYGLDGLPNSDAEVVQTVFMFILSFPASFVAGAIAVAAAFGFELLVGASLQTSRIEMLFMWSLFFGARYLQWFWSVPQAELLIVAHGTEDSAATNRKRS